MSNNINWICIYKTNVDFEAEAIKGNLETQGIPTIILNKKDSAYQNFGYLEIHVDESKKDEAIVFLNSPNPENN